MCASCFVHDLDWFSDFSEVRGKTTSQVSVTPCAMFQYTWALGHDFQEQYRIMYSFKKSLRLVRESLFQLNVLPLMLGNTAPRTLVTWRRKLHWSGRVELLF